MLEAVKWGDEWRAGAEANAAAAETLSERQGEHATVLMMRAYDQNDMRPGRGGQREYW